MSYRKLEIWSLAMEQSILIHEVSFILPPFEFNETGRLIRRSSKSIRSNIVEAYGRRRYKSEYIRFLTYAYASVLETIDHLDTLVDTGSLNDQELYQCIRKLLDEYGRHLNSFIKRSEQEH